MKIVFLTTDDPLYLPEFFDTVLPQCPGLVAGVCMVPPLYRKETTWDGVRKYYRTFGFFDSVRLANRVVGARLRGQSIASVCARNGVSLENVADVNAPGFLQRLRQIEPDVLVSVSCPQIFKLPLIQLPPRGILNIHGAILPHYRGVMPSFWMLANGEKQAGVSIYFVNEKIDAGELCAQEVFDVLPGESLDGFLRRSKGIAARMLLDVLGRMQREDLARRPLDLAAGSYYSWPEPEAVARFRAQGRSVW